jgi:3'-5' exoribonuclease
LKTCYIADLHDGDTIDDVFLICSKSFSMSQNGTQYARIRLADKSGQIEAMHWDASENAYAGIAIDDHVLVRGQVSSYREKLQIRIDSLRKFNEKIDPADFLPVCPRDRGEMRAEFISLIDTIQHKHLSNLLKVFFADELFLETFCSAPAASRNHHAYIGGLLEHSLSVARFCDSISTQYPAANRDLMVTAALLHDIGKMEELSWTRSIRYTDCGQLLGHIMIGASLVEHAAEKIPDFHPMLKMMLVHMILSHHGELEYGSPKRPKSLEAILLHYADDVDAKVNAFQQAVSATEESNPWTERHWMFDRPLFKGLPGSILGSLSKPVPGNADDDQEIDPFDFDLFADPGN